jgi:hypothetical protein
VDCIDDQSEECIIAYGSANIYMLVTKKTRKLIIARDVTFGNFRNKVDTSMMMMMMKRKRRAISYWRC